LARPREAEIQVIEDALIYAVNYGIPLHICHVTTREGLGLIRDVKRGGVDVMCETCSHYLLMNESYLDELGPYVKMNPPLRTKDNQDALREGIYDGTVDSIGSDHAPDTRNEKDSDNSPSDVPGIETTVQLLLNSGLLPVKDENLLN
jgi:dihydroorotase-like cyclic amidohydrolase